MWFRSLSKLSTALVMALWLAPSAMANQASNDFALVDYCPAGFKFNEQSACKLDSIYNSYKSPHNSGVGGLKAGLPELRDGFRPQVIDLGRYLFFDPILSGDGSLACSSCHDPELGFSDGKGRAVGIHGQILERSAPSLWNIGFFQRLLWDGSKASLEEQMLGPLYSELEMGNTRAI